MRSVVVAIADRIRGRESRRLPIPKGGPIAIEAIDEQSRAVETLKTPSPLATGDSTTMSYTGTVPTDLHDETFEIRVTIGPSGVVYSCEQKPATQRASCVRGG